MLIDVGCPARRPVLAADLPMSAAWVSGSEPTLRPTWQLPEGKSSALVVSCGLACARGCLDSQPTPPPVPPRVRRRAAAWMQHPAAVPLPGAPATLVEGQARSLRGLRPPLPRPSSGGGGSMTTAPRHSAATLAGGWCGMQQVSAPSCSPEVGFESASSWGTRA